MSPSKQRIIIGIDEVGRAKPAVAGRPLRNNVRMNLSRQHQKIIIGIDEVGRGALAGPVVVAGFAARGRFFPRNSNLGALRDSKKLTPKKREKWFEYFLSKPELRWEVSRVTPKIIDRVNISVAANMASLRVIKKLGLRGKGFFVYLDGGLRLPENIPHRSIIKGDEKIKVIAAASIMAKVTRDRAMRHLHKKDRRYRFDIHKGYGTELHRELIGRHGYSDNHRKTFILK
ncbi:MAG: ribonuclease HII [bacterium]|nr:ribonuclease HII [bacterium]